MKNHLVHIVLFFAFLSVLEAKGQDSAFPLNSTWKKLTTALEHRTDLDLNMAGLIEKSKSPEKDYTGDVRSDAARLRTAIVSTKKLDSLAVREIFMKDSALTQSTAIAWVWITETGDRKSKNELKILQAQLDGADNRITVAKRDYNNLCIETNRRDLLFEEKR